MTTRKRHTTLKYNKAIMKGKQQRGRRSQIYSAARGAAFMLMRWLLRVAFTELRDSEFNWFHRCTHSRLYSRVAGILSSSPSSLSCRAREKFSRCSELRTRGRCVARDSKWSRVWSLNEKFSNNLSVKSKKASFRLAPVTSCPRCIYVSNYDDVTALTSESRGPYILVNLKQFRQYETFAHKSLHLEKHLARYASI